MNGETGISFAGYVHVIILAQICVSSLFTMLLHICLAFEILFEVACVNIYWYGGNDFFLFGYHKDPGNMR